MVIRKERALLAVGAASSRDHLISRLEAAPTEIFYADLDFPDKRYKFFRTASALLLSVNNKVEFK